MKDIDYENMFIYMSLVFAFCIFIILLYGCAFASGTTRGGSGAGGSQIYENFLNEDDKGDIKSQVVSLLTELEGKDTTSADDKKKLSDALEKINNNNISITELKTIIDRDNDGSDLGTTTKSVKYSVFVPILIKAIQELKAEFDAYKASHP